MRILVISKLYPPVALGGYEVECSSVVERLRESHQVRVLTSDRDRRLVPSDHDVDRELKYLTPDQSGALRAPAASVRAVTLARRALAWRPDLVYVWNGAEIPHAALRVLADSGAPLAFRVCEHWFGGLFRADQFLRELAPARRGPGRTMWSLGCRALNALPPLRLDPLAPARAGISWASAALQRLVEVPRFLEPTLERVCHPVPRYGDLYAQSVRHPATEPEVVFLGRVTPYKGLGVALEAVALLQSQYRLASRLIVVGPEDTRYGTEMRRLASRLGVSEQVSWRGAGTPEQAVAALSRAHALIVPSTWQDPFPLVPIEGAFARVPIVASDVGGISEGMHDEEHALLFPAGDASAAASALARTLSDREGTAARVRRARKRAEQFRLGPYLDRQERFVEEIARSSQR